MKRKKKNRTVLQKCFFLWDVLYRAVPECVVAGHLQVGTQHTAAVDQGHHLPGFWNGAASSSEGVDGAARR